MTVAQLLDEAWDRVNDAQGETARAGGLGHAMREYALAKTAIEDARMRYNRGRAMQFGMFKPVDLDAEDAHVEQPRPEDA